jgi:outer membrane receptor for ferrienterochelin and colicins
MIRIFKPLALITIFSIGLPMAGAHGQTPAPSGMPFQPDITSSPTPSSTAPVYEMKELVVYADKNPGEVIDGKRLDSLKADSRLGDLLDQNAGVETEGLGIAKSFSNISIRGSATNQTLILLNGQRTNQGFDLSMIPTEDIERIEVIKGPAALAYGPDATGGVINIITRVQNQGGSLSTSVGDFGTYQLHGSTGDWHIGPWQGSLSGNGFNTNGYTANTDLVNWELDQSSHFDLGQDQAALTANYVYKNGGSPNGDSLSTYDTGQFDTDDREVKKAFSTVANDERTMGNWTLNPSFSYNYANVTRLNPIGQDLEAGVPPTDLNIYNTFDFLTNATGQWNDWFHSLSFGVEFRSEQVQGTEGLGDGVRTNDVTSFSVKGTLGFTQTLSLQWSGRLDWYNTYNLIEFDPEGTLKYEWTHNQDVYFSAGTGFRYPDFDELYHPEIDYLIVDSSGNPTGVPVEFGDGEVGNPHLQPENSVNLETGIDLGWNNFSFKINGFSNFYTNLIIPAEILFNSPLYPGPVTETNGNVIANPVPYWSYDNVSQALVIGLETNFNWDFSKWGSIYGGYTFADSTDTQTHQFIPGRMRDKVSGGFIFRFEKDSELNIYEQYVDRNPAVYTGPQNDPPIVIASAYSLLNTDFKTQIDMDMKAFLSFKNLLNQQYATIQGLIMPGRYFEVGTTVNF